MASYSVLSKGELFYGQNDCDHDAKLGSFKAAKAFFICADTVELRPG